MIIEPVQGEGGARSLPESQLTRLRQLCTEHGALLIYDEIQCGLGRTGKLFAHEWAEDAAPDIMCVAKALGNGFPVGACLATAEAAKGMTVGSHGSTYGGNPLAMAVGLAALEELTKPETLQNVRDVGGYLGQQLTGLMERHPDVVAEIRGKGLLIGLQAEGEQPRVHGPRPRRAAADRRRQRQLRAPLAIAAPHPRRGPRGSRETGARLRDGQGEGKGGCVMTGAPPLRRPVGHRGGGSARHPRRRAPAQGGAGRLDQGAGSMPMRPAATGPWR